MRLFGNLIWLIFGGFPAGLSYLIAGALLCLTLIGLPFGIKAMQFGWMVMLPFGRTLESTAAPRGWAGWLLNLIWLAAAGWAIALMHIFFGTVLAGTLVGIPFALQHFKLVPVALFPFSYRLRRA